MVPRKHQLLRIGVVPDSDQCHRRREEKSAKHRRKPNGVRQLVDQAPPADADLESHRRRGPPAGNPLDADSCDEAVGVVVVAVEVARGVDPAAGDRGDGGDGDGDGGAEEVDGVDAELCGVDLALVDGDPCRRW